MIKVGDIVKNVTIRGQVMEISKDKSMVAVCTFPQDVAYSEALHYQKWSIGNIKKERKEVPKCQ